MSGHAKATARSSAQTIEALYELHCWDWRTGENPDPLTADARGLVEELEREHGSLAECRDVQSVITQYAREWPVEVKRDPETESFEILVCTGGPAVRITGSLYQGEPDWRAGNRPDLQWRDWFQDWTVSDYAVDCNAMLWFACQVVG